MQIAQIHESETGVRWQHAEDVKACHNCQKAFRSNRDKVGKIINSNRIEWMSVIIQVITKLDDFEAGVRFVYHECDYRLNWMTHSLITN